MKRIDATASKRLNGGYDRNNIPNVTKYSAGMAYQPVYVNGVPNTAQTPQQIANTNYNNTVKTSGYYQPAPTGVYQTPSGIGGWICGYVSYVANGCSFNTGSCAYGGR